MLALYSMLSKTYYAQNYAVIIGLGLLSKQSSNSQNRLLFLYGNKESDLHYNYYTKCFHNAGIIILCLIIMLKLFQHN